MIKLFTICTFLFCTAGNNLINHDKLGSSYTSQPSQTKSIYDFKVDALNGGTIDFADFKKKKY